MLTSHDILRVLLKIPRSQRKAILDAFRTWVRLLEPGAAAKQRRPRRRAGLPRKRASNDRRARRGSILGALGLLSFVL